MRWLLVFAFVVAGLGSADAQVFKPRTGAPAPTKSAPKKKADDSKKADDPDSTDKPAANKSKKATRATKKKKGKKGDDDFVEVTDDED